jgi:hypothetical protein
MANPVRKPEESPVNDEPELDDEPEDDDPSPHCSQCPNDPCDCKIADNE